MVHNHLKGFWPLVDICQGLFSQVPTGYKMILFVLYRYPETTIIGTNESTSVPSHITRVGFTAVTTDHQMNMGMDQTVQFPKIITNIGNGFDSLLGFRELPFLVYIYLAHPFLAMLEMKFDAKLYIMEKDWSLYLPEILRHIQLGQSRLFWTSSKMMKYG